MGKEKKVAVCNTLKYTSKKISCMEGWMIGYEW